MCRGATSTPRARASASAIDISSASLRSRRYVGPRSLASSATFSSPGKSGSAAVNGRHITWCWGIEPLLVHIAALLDEPAEAHRLAGARRAPRSVHRPGQRPFLIERLL